jgi:hypothetical protein
VAVRATALLVKHLRHLTSHRGLGMPSDDATFGCLRPLGPFGLLSPPVASLEDITRDAGDDFRIGVIHTEHHGHLLLRGPSKSTKDHFGHNNLAVR